VLSASIPESPWRPPAALETAPLAAGRCQGSPMTGPGPAPRRRACVTLGRRVGHGLWARIAMPVSPRPLLPPAEPMSHIIYIYIYIYIYIRTQARPHPWPICVAPVSSSTRVAPAHDRAWSSRKRPGARLLEKLEIREDVATPPSIPPGGWQLHPCAPFSPAAESARQRICESYLSE
jgi:hypothetical protein